MSENINQYDIIGDVHGRWDKLEPLLAKLGYKHDSQCHVHPEGRQAIFLGDLIDPKGDYPNGTREVLHCVRDMVLAKHAYCVLGNHEYNFVAYHTPDGQGGYLRLHSEKNGKMHAGTLEALEKYPEELKEVWLPWLKTLPFYLDFPEFRIVHACWHPGYLSMLGGKTLGDDELLRNSSIKGTPEYLAVETVLKGVELPMPTGHYFFDHQGNKRTEFRARWWDKGQWNPTAKSMLFPAKKDFPDTPLDDRDVQKLPGYGAKEKPVFFGHYYKPADSLQELEAPNLCCLDLSAAVDGPLTAYRFDQPQSELDKDFIVSSIAEGPELQVIDQIIAFLQTMPAMGFDEDNAWETLVNSKGELYFDDSYHAAYLEWVTHVLDQYSEEALLKAWMVDTNEGRSFLWSYQYDRDHDDDPDHTADDQPSWNDYLKDPEAGPMPSHYFSELRVHAEDLASERELAPFEDEFFEETEEPEIEEQTSTHEEVLSADNVVDNLQSLKLLAEGFSHYIYLMRHEGNGQLYTSLTIDDGCTITYYSPISQNELCVLKEMESRDMMLRIMELSQGRKNICHDLGRYCWIDHIFHPHA